MMKMWGKKMEPSAPSYNRDCAFSFHGSGGGVPKIFEEVPDTKKGDMEEKAKGMRGKRRTVRKKTE